MDCILGIPELSFPHSSTRCARPEAEGVLHVRSPGACAPCTLLLSGPSFSKTGRPFSLAGQAEDLGNEVRGRRSSRLSRLSHQVVSSLLPWKRGLKRERSESGLEGPRRQPRSCRSSPGSCLQPPGSSALSIWGNGARVAPGSTADAQSPASYSQGTLSQALPAPAPCRGHHRSAVAAALMTPGYRLPKGHPAGP